MKFEYNSIRILSETAAGSGPCDTLRQTQYDLNRVQDHEVDVPLSSIFVDSIRLGCAGALAILLTIPVGIVALLAMYGQSPAAKNVLPTFGIIPGVCTVVSYPIRCLLEMRQAAYVAASQQRSSTPNEKIYYVPAEEWESFIASIFASTDRLNRFMIHFLLLIHMNLFAMPFA
ncbi:MAG: hypothetical protein KDB01_01370 [Planctomycetaceae bacterium]|nr:hypothetical protein [Planctomycetaceae bacterium]